MSFSGSGAGQGAAQAAQMGMAFGPWGALIGGVAGGAMGYLSGDDPYQRTPYLQAPDNPGGVLGDYGGMMRDPVTGLVTYTNNNFSGANSDLMRNRYLQDRLMGGTGAGATNDLDAQILFQQSIIDPIDDGSVRRLCRCDRRDVGLLDLIKNLVHEVKQPRGDLDKRF